MKKLIGITLVFAAACFGDYTIESVPVPILVIKCDGDIVLRGKVIAHDKEVGESACRQSGGSVLNWMGTPFKVNPQ